ncbi:Putative peptidoglycan bound protein [Labilithrix luteola]|uniref:Putative peptidoglycan bound protein n=1 Tax=Labilithrix luteola TaxID=1391654 RepID=A0A0K1Q6K7_9BACT|nr:hypothetical protein [Labilithrix luteola]AKV01471.1 Putative peptidoglycan bound protein [Labilithrix luteola]
MRLAKVLCFVPFLLTGVAGLTGLPGCSSAAEEDSEGSAQGVTGGSGSTQSALALVFDDAKAEAPKCSAAMLSDTVAVTAKDCAKVGQLVGRASDKDGKGVRSKIKAVHVPDTDDAEIAVVELDKGLEGLYALVTHMPLRDGYSVNAVSSKDAWFGPDKNEAASVTASIHGETDAHGILVPDTGSEICDGDIGALVCSSTSTLFGLRGTCGLSGIVVGRDEATPATKASKTAGCSNGGWKVAKLGQYADFLKKYAPKAFQPLDGWWKYTPEGLWGYESSGSVKSCKIDTTTLASSVPNKASTTIKATVSFTKMSKRAAAWGRFGIAPKSDPTNMRWSAAALANKSSGSADFNAAFQGAVKASNIGDYIVTFRTTGNGGESWVTCDLDGIDNGYSADKTLSFSVGETGGGTTNPTDPSTPDAGSTADAGSPSGSDAGSKADAGSSSGADDPSASTDGETTYTDPSSSNDRDETDGEGYSEGEEGTVNPKKKGQSGCSVNHAGGASSSAPLFGLLLGLAAFARSRRRAN